MKQKVMLDPVQADALNQLTGGELQPIEDAEEAASELLAGGGSLRDDEVDALGETFGVSYDMAEELFCGEKEFEGDRHRWELDPASSEDYVDRCRLTRSAWRWRHFNH